MCISHGGGFRCQVDGCNSYRQTGGKCKKHGGGSRRSRCNVDGCEKLVKSGGKCTKHGGGYRCRVLGCSSLRQTGGQCVKHGGGPRCQIDGCDKSIKHVGTKCKGHRDNQKVVGSLQIPCTSAFTGQVTSLSTSSSTTMTSLTLKDDEMEPQQDDTMKGVLINNSSKF